MTDLFTRRRAWFSDCRRWRWMLEIRWAPGGRVLVALMLNPSKADEEGNDPTVERIEQRARRLGYSAVIILNAFAWVETNRLAMLQVEDPVGRFNDNYLRTTLREVKIVGGDVMVGWGNEGGHRGRHLEVQAILDEVGIQALCLGTNANGQPVHPLYQSYDKPLIPWRAA